MATPTREEISTTDNGQLTTSGFDGESLEFPILKSSNLCQAIPYISLGNGSLFRSAPGIKSALQLSDCVLMLLGILLLAVILAKLFNLIKKTANTSSGVRFDNYFPAFLSCAVLVYLV